MNHPLAFYGAIILFGIVYATIMGGKFNRTVIALTGGLIMILLGLLSQEVALKDDIDFNTIGLLIGMMMLVGITRRSGIFEAIAIWAAQVTKGYPLFLFTLLAIITATASALLDNVTTVLLIVPVTITLTEHLHIDPIAFLIMEIIASNIGGTATLIGDPPNIMIGSAAHLSFTDFILHLAPIALFILFITIGLLLLFYRKNLQVKDEHRLQVLTLSPKAQIKDWPLCQKSVLVLVLTMTGFLFHNTLHLESATIALTGALLLMIISGEEPGNVLLQVDWSTIFFFVGLFMLVGGLKATGVITAMAEWALTLTGSQLDLMTYVVLWLSAIASAVVDNIPLVATMIPMLKEMSIISGTSVQPVWWALSLGACLGGSGTLIGASANVIVADLATKNGYPFSFRQYLTVAFPLMLLSIIICHIYIYWRYF